MIFLSFVIMKRILVIIFTVFYFGVSQGATVYFHYCMDELVQMELSKSNPSACGFCGMTTKEAKDNSCCEKEAKQFKVNDAQKIAVSNFQFEQSPVILFKSVVWEDSYVVMPLQLGKADLSNAPPPFYDVPVFIRNCTYRI